MIWNGISLFNNLFLLFATVSLVIQVFVVSLLAYGYWLKRKSKFERHGRVMVCAVAVHLAMIFSFMIPTLILAIIPVFVVPHVSGLISVVALIHAPLGAVAVSLGLWLAFSWRSSGTASCFKRKRYMLATITVWLAGLSLGIILYTVLYWTVLMS